MAYQPVRVMPDLRTARCNGVDVELFFPLRDDRAEGADIVLAKSFCQKCPVKAECLEWGMNYEEFGIWGGYTASERRHARRHGLRLMP